MKYRVSLDGQEHDVDLQITEAGSVAVAVDGEPFAADVRRVPGGVHLLLGNQCLDVVVSGPPEEKTVAAGFARGVATGEDERRRARRARTSAGGGGSMEIRAPMPGRVVKLLASVGEAVQAGQSVIIVEAMKMENELRATVAGEVAEVLASEGQSVEGNMLLMRLRPVSPS